ncbi:hypothetical protein J1N35_007588, partial [Gossypium stocksii]
RKNVCAETWIYHSMFKCISGLKAGILFPHLVMTLCQKEKVSITATKQFLKPTKSLIGDSIFMQYIEFQRRQIIEWNQRRKKKMDVPPPLSTKKGKKKEGKRTRKLRAR